MEAKIEIVKELSLLYELSLSIGGTLNLSQTSENFLKVWMRQKNIDFGSIWIKKDEKFTEEQNHFSLIYAHPFFLVSKEKLELNSDFWGKLKIQKAIKIDAQDREFNYFVDEAKSDFGALWIIEIPNLGFIQLVFHKENPSQFTFGYQEVKKASKVLEKLSFALQSCLLHSRVLEQNKQKIKFKNEIRKLALVIEKTDNAIIITDENGQIEWVNNGFVNIYEFSAKEAFRKNFQDILVGSKTDLETSDYIKDQIQKENTFKIEMIFNSKTNKEFWIELNIQPIYNDENILVNYIAVALNISDRKKNEEELKQAKEKAEEASRIKQEFLSVVSHEIRTPLNGIIGMSNLLQKTPLSPQQSDYMNVIQVSGENLKLVINSILDFSKIESGDLSIQAIPFDLKKILLNLVDSNEFKAEQKGLGLFLKIDSKIAENLIGDGIRLSQVLLNLVSNAIKFTYTGKVEIEARLVSKMNDALVIEFSVEDTGKGIPDEMQKMIFESFTQEDSSLGRKYGGTGLGLSISKKLVSLMGGEIKLSSVENLGTRMSFVLGFMVNKEQVLEPENPQISDTILIGKKVLLIEDNTMNQFFAQKLLEGWGMKTFIANNGKEGVEMFSKRHYDCILMDIQMPEMDGIQATKIIREQNQYIPIIALTALVIQEELENFKAVGMNDYITKPFEAEYLRKKLIFHVSGHQSYSISNPKKAEKIEIKLYNNQLLTQMMKGNQVQVRQMENLFVNQAEEIMNLMDVSYRDENYKEIGLLANKIKASIDMLQINSLKLCIRALENIEKKQLSQIVIEELMSTLKQTLLVVCLAIKKSHT